MSDSRAGLESVKRNAIHCQARGRLNQYDISGPFNPRQTGRIYIGGLLDKAPAANGREAHGGARMTQLSLDGRRLYTSTLLFSSCENQWGL